MLGDERIDSRDVYQQGTREWPEDQVAAATVLADISLDDAFETIRDHARSNHLTVRSVAQEVLDEGVHVVTGGSTLASAEEE